jgi:hypothetical protein
MTYHRHQSLVGFHHDFKRLGIYIFGRYLAQTIEDNSKQTSIILPLGKLKSSEVDSIQDIQNRMDLSKNLSSSAVYFLECTDDAKVKKIYEDLPCDDFGKY